MVENIQHSSMFCSFEKFQKNYKFYSGFDKNPRESIFELTGHCDSSTISGPYMINGKFLLLPITGQGMSNFTFGIVFDQSHH